MPEDDREDSAHLEIIGTPTVERMAEICREIAQEIDAMSPEERAEYLTKRTLDGQRDDERLFAGKSPEERQRLLEMREGFHDRMRERTHPTKRPIEIASPARSGSIFPWLEPTPEGLLGAEAALKAKRERSRRRSNPRSDGW